MAPKFTPPPFDLSKSPEEALTSALPQSSSLVVQHKQWQRQQELEDLKHQLNVAQIQKQLAEIGLAGQKQTSEFGTHTPLPTTVNELPGVSPTPQEASLMGGKPPPTVPLTGAALPTQQETIDSMGTTGAKAAADLNKSKPEPQFYLDPDKMKFFDNALKEVGSVPEGSKVTVLTRASTASSNQGVNKVPTQVEASKMLKDAMDSYSTTLAPLSKRMDAAKRTEAIFANGNPDISVFLRPEVAASAASLIMGGNNGRIPVELVNEFIPKSAYGDFNKLKQWIVNEPTGAGQQEFFKALQGLVAREKSTISGQISQARKERIAELEPVRQNYKAMYDASLRNHGLDPSRVINGSYTDEPTPQSPALHNAALDWATAHPNDPRAAAVKKKALAEGQ